MKYRNDLVRSALATQDPIKLFQLFESAIDMSDHSLAQLVFAKGRLTKLEDQVKRQAEMIAGLEKALWDRK